MKRRGCQGSFLHKTQKKHQKKSKPGRDKRAFTMCAGKQSAGWWEDKKAALGSELNK